MQNTVYKSISGINSLQEFSVGAISKEFKKYTSMVPRFQEFAFNSKDRFGDRKLFTPKTLQTACGSKALVLVSENTGKARLISMERCHNRFCPLCSYVEQKKDSLRIKAVLEQAFSAEDTVLLSFGLSFPNCTGAELNDQIKALNKAFKRFSKECFPEAVRDDIKIGTFRKLEVTLSEDYHKQMLEEGVEDYMNYPNLFHPHLHVLFHIRKSKYFGTPYYKTSEEYLDVWRRVSGRYDTINLKLKAKDVSVMSDQERNGLIRDLAFYVAKPNQLLENQDVFDIMVSALKFKQSYSFGGTLEQYALSYDCGDYSVKRKLSQNDSDNILEIYTHIALVSFNFDDDDGYYFCSDLQCMPRSLILGDADIGRLYNCSHLLSYDLFLNYAVLEGFMQGVSIESLLKIDMLRHFAS